MSRRIIPTLTDLGPGLILAATGIGVGDMVSATIARCAADVRVFGRPLGSHIAGIPSSVRRGLNTVQLGILAALRHQLVVCPDFDDVRPVEHHNQIGHPDRRETV